MKKVFGTLPDTQSAELACGKLKEECGGECKAAVQDTIESESSDLTPCDLIYMGSEDQAEKASHVLRSLGALNIHSADA